MLNCALALKCPAMTRHRANISVVSRDVPSAHVIYRMNVSSRLRFLTKTRYINPLAENYVVQKTHPFYLLNNSVNKSSAVAEMGDRLATIDVPKRGGCMLLCPFRGGEGAGSLSNTM